MTGLVIHSLKSKKNWFLLNLAICIVISIVLPMLFKTAFEFFAVSSLIIASVIILISNFSDLIFLHDDRKLSYFLSKPISLSKRLNVTLISNIIFCTVTFLVTFLISSFAASVISNTRYTQFIQDSMFYCHIIYVWLLVFVFVTTLASELTGNTTVSVLVSIFIFCLPLILYFVTTYIFYILDSVIVGINAEIMFRVFINKIFPLEKIYFIDYGVNGNVDILFFIRIFLICTVIYTTTMIYTKKRKNENTGNFIVHSSFKYFMSLFASLIAPMIVTMVMRRSNLTTLVTTLVILSTLSYYIIISLFNKTFKISSSSLKIYIPFITIIIVTVFTSSFILKDKSAYIPNEDEVEAVYIGSNPMYLDNATLLTKTTLNWESLIDKKYADIKDNDSIIIFTQKSNIKRITHLQSLLMNNDSNDYYQEIYIIYYMKDGKKIIRAYNTPSDYIEEITEKDIEIKKAIADIASQDEFINKKYKCFTDENYINKVKHKDIYYYSGGKSSIKNLDYSTFSKCYIEDYKVFINNENDITSISTDIFLVGRSYQFMSDYYIKGDFPVPTEQYSENIPSEIIFEYEQYDGISPEFIVLNGAMVKTRAYIESLIK